MLHYCQKCASFAKDKLSLWIIIMTVDVDKDTDGSRLWLASWPKALASDPLISPGEVIECGRVVFMPLLWSLAQ